MQQQVNMCLNFQTSDIFSTFPESLYNHANASNGIGSNDNDGINGQPIPASIRPKPFASGLSSGSNLGHDEKNSESIRVRSPQTLQRVAFDVATLRQSSASASFKKSATKNDDDDENVDSVNVTNEPEPASLARAEPRKAETLVA